MMKAIIPLLLAIALAGCGSDGHNLDPYLLEPFDLPDACYHLDVDDEDFQEIKAITGFDENPGSINNSLMEVGNITPVDNRLALFECLLDGDEYQIVSAALEFRDAQAAQQWIAEVEDAANPFTGGLRCVPQAMLLEDGKVIAGMATISEEWHPVVREHADGAYQEMLDEHDARDYCADD